jgi:hypothetical protein
MIGLVLHTFVSLKSLRYVCAMIPLLNPATCLAQDSPFEGKPKSPFHAAAYVGSAERNDENVFAFGMQIELANRSPVLPFVGNLDSKLGNAFEFGLSTGFHVSAPRIYAGPSLMLYNLDTAVFGMRAGMDVPVWRQLGVRLEVRNYGGEDWFYGLAATAPPFRRPSKD